jgi:hypothetical protein
MIIVVQKSIKENELIDSVSVSYREDLTFQFNFMIGAQ